MAPIKVAVLDDYHKISSEFLAKLPSSAFEITYFPSTLPSYAHPSTATSSKAELVARLAPFEIISTIRERTPFPGALLEQLPNLKLLQTTSTRNLAIDLDAARCLGIAVVGTSFCGKPADAPPGPDSTTQHTIALILALARNIPADDLAVKTGAWQTTLALPLAGRTVGIVGLGRLGIAVASILYRAFGMCVVAWSSSLTQEAADEKAAAEGLLIESAWGKTFEVVTKEELFRRADVVSVHYVLSERSRGVVGRAELALLKPSSLLVNTSRGPLVDEEALLEVLKEGKIGGAALDVYELEPLPKESEWRSEKWGKEGRSRLVLTPHMGYVEEGTLRPWAEEAVRNIEKWGKGGGGELTTLSG
ncbi:hypothetical protein VC83_01281 [Pseudogymnoascus destructans]|uniref:D-isomer specific 2-hydroxyacid dehydrogenase NAD-binding domain-containing protein n=2 Tax=Pseudogymnoascus destructans TaxID=655981 RepID=L8G6Y6_PSED2|nr:uncharacterized protein VC83_01281 [Pseudogymnoascus destructans]ELR08433.1 hypothetical protein GMDG_00497 [Pseudogymnoascus destructans 20631-21]OAF62240.1 hypothetical protein VC83_01281 [Pseudogymnoascus destructans]